MVKIDTTLRQWCKAHNEATPNRRCPIAPYVCCAKCCPPGRGECEVEVDDELR